jgi:hypothetical protein
VQFDRFQRQVIERAVQTHGGNWAAERLGLR